MTYPDVIKAGDLRQGDFIHTDTGTVREVLATCWKPGYSFIGFIVEGEQVSRQMPIGRAMQVRRQSS